jgi:hypothetical protein
MTPEFIAHDEYSREVTEAVWSGYIEAGFGTRRKRRPAGELVSGTSAIKASTVREAGNPSNLPDYEPPVGGGGVSALVVHDPTRSLG